MSYMTRPTAAAGTEGARRRWRCYHPISSGLRERHARAQLEETVDDTWRVICYDCEEVAEAATPKEAVIRWHGGRRVDFWQYLGGLLLPRTCGA